MNFKLQPKRQMDRGQAWGCFFANLALPGSGSLLAGRAIGYAQMVLACLGLLVSMGTTLQFFTWFFKHMDQMATSADPLENLRQMWHFIRWPLAGLLIFGIALAWAAVTSLAIFTQSRPAPPQNIPPILP